MMMSMGEQHSHCLIPTGLHRVISAYSQGESSWKVWLHWSWKARQKTKWKRICLHLLWKARQKQSGRESGRPVIHQSSKSSFKTLSNRPETHWPGDTRSQTRGGSFFWFRFIVKTLLNLFVPEDGSPVQAPIDWCQITSHLCWSVLALKHEVSKTQDDPANQREMSLPAPHEKFTVSDPEQCGSSVSVHRNTACVKGNLLKRNKYLVCVLLFYFL